MKISKNHLDIPVWQTYDKNDSTKPTKAIVSNAGDCNVDDLTFKIVGNFGKWQLWLSIYMAMLKMPLAWYQLNIIFMAPPQDYWCAKPESFNMYTEQEWRDICAPGTVPALYLFSGELFPTIGRNSGVAGVTTFARISAMVAPAIVSLDGVMHDLPLVLLAIMSFGQLALLVPLPETKGQPLPDTLAQAEQFNKRYQQPKRLEQDVVKQGLEAISYRILKSGH
ncbi:jg21110 [Pararge aegeria aegeria]|uniref:Jg21110 protein n=1 Tax=Pararge aegeria aegeria TaxID=348720 RepID=A0A8S4RQI5_9NEOP|nr:jg21110 [Pararge aegeria aegeria]